MLLRLHLSPLPPKPHQSPNPNPNPNPNPSSYSSVSLPLQRLPPPLSSSSCATAAAAAADAGILFREKLLYLEHELGVDPSRALALNPSLRSAPISSLRSAASLLLAFGLLPSDASRVFSQHPHLLTSDPSLSLLPSLRFLLGPVAIPFPHLRSAVLRCPRLLASSVPLQLHPTLLFLRRVGFVGPRRITAHTALLLVSSVERTLIPKLDFLRSLGLSDRDTNKLVLRSPSILTFSVDRNLRPKAEFLTQQMGRDAVELKAFPQYFSFSLEGRIKPRHRMLKESGLAMPLSEMLKVSDGEFRVRLVDMRLRKFDECL
ncbi:transcription termination factor MTEF1, chloroplastic-like [Ananas comosus]|uniref:Transcription termination factor MTEF1, chloroplastic-like n=1 Tax=Ananas comosus TaxID=4615 RepID=A0A6P5GWU6_ANACO|nr:transcription termination factor MTEF1, chloroplastic-like [Ananas comosus]XP_020110131.1 transcription termination factor MTEF1, chloroplastic-like [Ananas comosus]